MKAKIWRRATEEKCIIPHDSYIGLRLSPHSATEGVYKRHTHDGNVEISQSPSGLVLYAKVPSQ